MPHLSDRCCEIAELRQYTMVPGRLDELIELFEREFIETQEAVGSHVLGTFTDLDDPDRFVWIRGFASLDDRTRALRAFYGSAVWSDNSAAANATMTDSDNVLLLRPADGRGLPDTSASDGTASSRKFGVTVYALELGADDSASVAAVPGSALSVLRTHPGPNAFKGLPVREGEQVIVVLTDGEPIKVELPGAEIIQTLRLSPTSRSALR